MSGDNNMQLHQIKPTTVRKSRKRVGRGGKRGTYSGKGTKGQKSRAGAGIKPGFRGGDNRLWQVFPKQRGASKKPGGKKPHRKHRFFQIRYSKPAVVNVGELNIYADGEYVTPVTLLKKGLIRSTSVGVKVLGEGALSKKVRISGVKVSKSAKEKVIGAGGNIVEDE